MTDTVQLLRDALDKPLTYLREYDGGYVECWDDSEGAFPVYRAAPLPAQPQGQGAWEPKFDAMHAQEQLAIKFCQEIAGKRGEKPSPPDPVRLLEMAEALYLAERNDAAPPSQAPEPAQQEAAGMHTVIQDALNTVLWLEHRLPKGYGDVPHVKRTIAALEAASLPSPAPLQAKTGEHEPKAGELTGKTGEQAAVPSERETINSYSRNSNNSFDNPIASPVVSDSEIDRKLCGNIDAILNLDAAGVLVPHGIGGHARSLLTDAAARIRALARTAPVVAEWMPIETAPKEGRTLILLLTPSRHPQVAYSNTWWKAGFSVECKPTHWAPIAPLPAQGEGT